jgi:hypothetical protein
LARVVKRCQELPGQDLFLYLDEEGNRHTVSSSDVNDFLRSLTGADFTAKDYRTWAGTAMALAVLRELEWQPESEVKRQVVSVVKEVTPTGQHARGVPQVLHPPGRAGAFQPGGAIEIAEAEGSEGVKGGRSSVGDVSGAARRLARKEDPLRPPHVADEPNTSLIRLSPVWWTNHERHPLDDSNSTGPASPEMLIAWLRCCGNASRFRIVVSLILSRALVRSRLQDF